MRPLTLRLVVAEAFSTYRAQFLRVAVPALLVFVPIGVGEAFLEDLVRAYEEDESGAGGIVVLGLSLVSTSAVLFGGAFYAGLLEGLVGEQHFGHVNRPVRDVIRTLPYRRLIAADLIVSVIVIAGLILLLVPGLVAFTLLGIVGPLITIEGLGVRAALRRSVRLVRRRFWLVFVAITIPLLVEGAAEDAAIGVLLDADLGSGIVLEAFVAVVVGAVVGLLEVTLAYELIARDRKVESSPDVRQVHVDA